jgi:hypothetical protein
VTLDSPALGSYGNVGELLLTQEPHEHAQQVVLQTQRHEIVVKIRFFYKHIMLTSKYRIKAVQAK